MVSVGILSDGSVGSGRLPCQPVAILGRGGGGTTLEPLGRPSITLVMRAITTGVCPLTLVIRVMLLMVARVPSITLVMGLVSPPRVRMLTAVVVPILVRSAGVLGQ